ncbi:hypothetical protein Hanom_Chr12g01129351 [Helianthus anomalus]
MFFACAFINFNHPTAPPFTTAAAIPPTTVLRLSGNSHQQQPFSNWKQMTV